MSESGGGEPDRGEAALEQAMQNCLDSSRSFCEAAGSFSEVCEFHAPSELWDSSIVAVYCMPLNAIARRRLRSGEGGGGKRARAWVSVCVPGPH